MFLAEATRKVKIPKRTASDIQKLAEQRKELYEELDIAPPVTAPVQDLAVTRQSWCCQIGWELAPAGVGPRFARLVLPRFTQVLYITECVTLFATSSLSFLFSLVFSSNTVFIPVGFTFVVIRAPGLSHSVYAVILLYLLRGI
jgi:hypothetical protein